MYVENTVQLIDYILETDRRKRHVVGGILLSASFLFAGLAITVMTLKGEDKEDE